MSSEFTCYQCPWCLGVFAAQKVDQHKLTCKARGGEQWITQEEARRIAREEIKAANPWLWHAAEAPSTEQIRVAQSVEQPIPNRQVACSIHAPDATHEAETAELRQELAKANQALDELAAINRPGRWSFNEYVRILRRTERLL